MAFSQPAIGQFVDVQVPENPVRGTEANIFATWQGADPIDGMIVELPMGWSLESATVLRDGYRPLSAKIERLDGSQHRIIIGDPLDIRADLVLRLKVGDSYAAERLEIVPLVRAGAGFRSRRALAVSRTVRARDAAVDLENRVLSFAAEDGRPVMFRREAPIDLHVRSAFSLTFWMKTTDIGEVVLSTWNGDDRIGYPVEIVVDPAGRLRAYRGRPGEHQSLGSKSPIADGRWHHVAVLNDPDQGWVRLAVDGQNVDSLYAPAPPDIHMELPMTLGGRVEGDEPYFDGLAPYSGEIDELAISSVASNGERAVLSLDFEEPIPSNILVRGPRGASRISSDRVVGADAVDVRIDYVSDGIELFWSSSAERVEEFVVERSADGQTFVEIERLSPSDAGEYRVHDSGADSGVVYYRVRQIFRGGMEHVSGTVKVGIGEEQPSSAAVLGNYPNPFNASTTVTYEVRSAIDVQLAIWDLSGQLVQMLVDRRQNSGVYQARFEADGLPSGTYFVRLRTPEGIQSHKMILAK